MSSLFCVLETDFRILEEHDVLLTALQHYIISPTTLSFVIFDVTLCLVLNMASAFFHPVPEILLFSTRAFYYVKSDLQHFI